MEQVKIRVERRENVGSRATKALRLKGYVPAVVYGHKAESISLAIPMKTAEDILRRHVRIMTIDFGDNTDQAMIKDLHWDALGEKLLHIDFLRVKMDEIVSMAVPLQSVGRAKGVEEGGILETLRSEVQIKCLPTQVPESITFDVSELDLHDSLHIKDLVLPEGVTIDDDPEQVVVSIVARVETVTEEPPAEEAEGEAPSEEAKEEDQEEKKEKKEDKGKDDA
jgi:large subunit ribosomal protein L25